MAEEHATRELSLVLFQLFRIKAYASSQESLFPSALSPAMAVKEAIFERPTAPGRGAHEWHIGNVKDIGLGGLYFAIGRTTRATIPTYDESKGEFLETEFESAPYTHAVLDVEREICGIARNARLAPTPAGIARRLEALLNQSSLAMKGDYSFEVAAIHNPAEFIEQLRTATAVTRFSFTFKRPNPIDPYKDVFEPLGRTLVAVQGENGRTTVKGKDLNEPVLEEITRSVASTGDDAEADLVVSPGSKPVRRRLRSNETTFAAEEPQDEAGFRAVLEQMRYLYDQVRRQR